MIELLLPVLTAVVIARMVTPWVKRKLKIKQQVRVKPFDCSGCMSAWLGLTLHVLSHLSLTYWAANCWMALFILPSYYLLGYCLERYLIKNDYIPR